MSNYSLIPPTVFDNLVLGAGVILNNFNPDTGQFSVNDIVCSTTGGVQISCKPNRIDLAEGAENIPPGLLDFDYIQSWNGEMSFTSLNMTADGILLALGAGTLMSEAIETVTPITGLAADYTRSIWWVGPRGDDGIAAVYLKNLVSPDGISVKTQNRQKAGVSVTLSSRQRRGEKEPPVIFYAIDPSIEGLTLEDEITGEQYSVTVENGEMVYANNADGPTKKMYRLIDSVTGEIYAVRVAGGELYYQKGNSDG